MEIPYISLHDFAAINDSMRTRVRHFDLNFWQCRASTLFSESVDQHMNRFIPLLVMLLDLFVGTLSNSVQELVLIHL